MTLVTSCGYHVVMKTVGIADLKSRLSHHLRCVRAGEPVTVMDRRQPIATIVPYEEFAPLVVRRPEPDAPTLQEVELPPPIELRVSVLEALREERQVDR